MSIVDIAVIILCILAVLLFPESWNDAICDRYENFFRKMENKKSKEEIWR